MALKIFVNIGSGNDLVHDGTKPLPELMLTYHQWGPMAFIYMTRILQKKPLYRYQPPASCVAKSSAIIILTVQDESALVLDAEGV